MKCDFCGDNLILIIDETGKVAKKIWKCPTCGSRKFEEEEVKNNG